MKKLRYFLILLILILLEVSFGSWRKFLFAFPDLMLSAVIMYGFIFIFRKGWLILLALASGILKEAVLAGTGGARIILYLLSGLFASYIAKKISVEHIAVRIFIVGLIVLANEIILYLINYFFKGNQAGFFYFARVSLLTAVYSAFSLFLIEKLNKYLIKDIDAR